MQGIYIVELLNGKPMPVTRDKRYVNSCSKVSKLNIKVGKAKDFSKRKRNYWQDFDQENVIFTPLAKMDITHRNQSGIKPETAILRHLKQYQIKSPKGGRLEWLENINANEVVEKVFLVLENEGFNYSKVC